MSTYKITNVGANKCLNIYGDNVTSLSNHQNVTLWADSNTNEQKWVIDSLGAGVFVRSMVDTRFGLNVYRDSTYNCDVYPVNGNETDAKIDFIATAGGYKIKLSNYARYLTAGGSANGANVYWGVEANSNYQLWTCSEVTSSAPKNHTYVNVTRNSIGLHIIETNADNIQMVNLKKQYSGLAACPYYGINGGFFNNAAGYETDYSCQNIALNNGVGLAPNNTGEANELGFSALVYTNGAITLENDVMVKADITNVAACTWAQGGGDLKLGNANWTTADLRFSSDALVNSTGRTAIVADTFTNKVYLIMHRESSSKSIVAFREAIQQYLGITSGSTRYVGLLLDGGGSSALKARDALGADKNISTTRKLCQIIALKDAT